MDLFLSKKPDEELLSRIVSDVRPVVFISDWISSPLSEEHHVIVLSQNKSEFPWGLSFGKEADDQEAWLLSAAWNLSILAGCRTLYTGSPLERAKPWHCIVFDQGRAFLADDSETRLMGDGEQEVNILRRLDQSYFPESFW
ncbi:MAG: hypothetical protein P1U68_05940 [Verrucomicrobiales bacterium]|nr:hypothetical protein [Verrucomicrobiales bacterium]